MSGGNEFNDAALWRRWREGLAEAGETAAEPDALILAAYAEHRLGRLGIDPEHDPAIAAVEAWLVEHPEALDDVLATQDLADPPAAESLVARAQDLIIAPRGNVVPLQRASGWRYAALSGIAASLIAAVLIGFSLGSSDVVDLSGPAQTAAVEQGLIGSPGTILSPDDEDIGI